MNPKVPDFEPCVGAREALSQEFGNSWLECEEQKVTANTHPTTSQSSFVSKPTGRAHRQQDVDLATVASLIWKEKCSACSIRRRSFLIGRSQNDHRIKLVRWRRIPTCTPRWNA